MPLYDYRCTECDREVEVMHGIHEDGPEICQLCGGAMRKALSPPAIHFKGSGWAKKDARTTSPSKASSAGEKASTDESKKTTESSSTDKRQSSSSESTSKAASTAGSTTD